MVARKKVPRKIEREVFKEAHNCCAKCGKDDLNKQRIHHIRPYAENPEHNLDHMILLCLDCHDDADRGIVSPDVLYDIKIQRAKIIPFPNAAGIPSVNIAGNNNVVAGRDVIQVDNSKHTYQKGKRSAPIIISGTMSTDARRYNYLEYLVEQYKVYKGWECNKKGEKMIHSLIRKAYFREFKCKVKDTPLDRFEEAAEYLQGRIADTMLGRNLRKRGQELFSTFDDFDKRK